MLDPHRTTRFWVATRMKIRTLIPLFAFYLTAAQAETFTQTGANGSNGLGSSLSTLIEPQKKTNP